MRVNSKTMPRCSQRGPGSLSMRWPTTTGAGGSTLVTRTLKKPPTGQVGEELPHDLNRRFNDRGWTGNKSRLCHLMIHVRPMTSHPKQPKLNQVLRQNPDTESNTAALRQKHLEPKHETTGNPSLISRKAQSTADEPS